MKAIVKVKKASAYAKYNGHTFNVESIMDKLICLNINGNSVDFSFTEVILVDVQKYYDEECVLFEREGTNEKIINSFNNYFFANKMQVFS